MGLVEKSEGKVEYNGEDLTNLHTKNIVKKGIVMVPEGRKVFDNLTVEENLILGAYTRTDVEGIKKGYKQYISNVS